MTDFRPIGTDINTDDIPNSIKRAAVRKNPRLITENLDAEFNNAISNKTNTTYYASQLASHFGATPMRGVRKHSGMQRSANSFSIDHVYDAPHNPFRNRAAVETPNDLAELHARFRYYAKNEPLVGVALELHSQYPLSTFELKHDDPFLQQEFNEIAEKLKLFKFMIGMAYEYFCIGECFPFGIFDDDKQPSVWKSFTLLNPLQVLVDSIPITDGRPSSIFRLRIEDSIKRIVANGPKHKETGSLYERIPADLIKACKEGTYLTLNPQQISHFKRPSNVFKVRGESILHRIMHLLAYRDKLRDALYCTADRHSTPREVWKVGSPENPATEEELGALASMVSASFNDPSQAIIWHDALQVDIIGTSDKMLPLQQQLDSIEEEMLIGLELNKGFLDSNYGAYANMSVALDILINRYLVFRQDLENWQKESVWAPLCRIHDIYKPTQAELSHRIRIKNHDKTPWVPNIHWNKQELRDSTAKINLMMQAREKLGKPGFPRERILQMMNEDPKNIKKMLEKEAKDDVVAKSNISLSGGPAGGLGAGPMGGGGGDLNIDASGLGGGIGGGSGKGDLSKMKDSDLPEFNGSGETKSMEPGGAASRSIENAQSPTS